MCIVVSAEEIKALVRSGEHSGLEMKKCKNTVPESVWETYSAFANTRGGVILLGVSEDKHKTGSDRFEITGVEDANKVVTDFFNQLHNPQKVSRSVLVDSDVRIVDVEDRTVVYINVPEADYRQKPIYLNQQLEYGTYRRVHEGDRRVTKEELALLLRDSVDNTDSQVIEHYGMEDVDAETLAKYRQAFNGYHPGHAYQELSDRDFMLQIGGYVVNRQTRVQGLTMAGLLMFGRGQHIHQNLPNFRVDYLDLIGIEPGSSKKWNDRLTDDGRWEDNLYNFLTQSLRKLLFTFPTEGKLEGVLRRDGGPLHEAIREAMINAITYCDYLLGGVLRIDRRTYRVVMRNPGTLRIPAQRIYQGDYTQARNSTIQKMLRMVGYGDNIGSGFMKIMKAWQTLGFGQPEIHEEPEVNEVWLTLPLPTNFSGRGTETTEGMKKGTETPEGTEKGTKRGTETPEGTEKLSELLPTETMAALNDLQQRMLGCLIEMPDITLVALAGKLDTSVKSLRVQRQKLEALGIVIEHIGAQKTGKWQIRVCR